MEQVIKVSEVNNENGNEMRMTSLDVADFTGLQHKNVLRSIRNMEPAWEKVNGLKFQLVEYTYKKGEQRPCMGKVRTGKFHPVLLH